MGPEPKQFFFWKTVVTFEDWHMKDINNGICCEEKEETKKKADKGVHLKLGVFNLKVRD